MKEIVATLSVERELIDELRVIEYEKGNGFLHFHSQIEVCIVEEGSVEVLINKEKRVLGRGDIAICLSYNAHSYLVLGKAKYTVLLLPTHVSESFYALMQTQTIAAPFICNSEYGEEFMKYLSYTKSKDINGFTRLGYVYMILGILKEALLDAAEQEGPDSRLLSDILLYIHQNYDQNLSLNSISKAFGYHSGYISAYFKSHLDIGISRYINIIRLKHAVSLMQEKKHNITQIALDCGFSSTRTFYRAFNSEFGCSPREYLTRLN